MVRYRPAIMNASIVQNKFAVNLLIAAAIFLNAMAPLSVVAKEISPADTASIDALFGDKIVICTPTGFKYVSIDELNERQKTGQDNSENHCPLCLINAFDTIQFTLSSENSFEFQYFYSARKFYNTERAQKPEPFLNSARPRAPPTILST